MQLKTEKEIIDKFYELHDKYAHPELRGGLTKEHLGAAIVILGWALGVTDDLKLDDPEVEDGN